jgi:hypothetical protein
MELYVFTVSRLQIGASIGHSFGLPLNPLKGTSYQPPFRGLGAIISSCAWIEGFLQYP